MRISDWSSDVCSADLVDPRNARIVLVEASPVLLGGFSEHLSDFACRTLARKGVTIRLNAPVKQVSSDEVVFGDETLPAGTVLWAAGTRVKGDRKSVGWGKGGSVCVAQGGRSDK